MRWGVLGKGIDREVESIGRVAGYRLLVCGGGCVVRAGDGLGGVAAGASQ